MSETIKNTHVYDVDRMSTCVCAMRCTLYGTRLKKKLNLFIFDFAHYSCIAYYIQPRKHTQQPTHVFPIEYKQIAVVQKRFKRTNVCTA